MKNLGILALVLGVFASSTQAIDFNGDGVQDTILYYGDRFVIKHNKSGVANSTVFYDAGWISTTPVETNNVAGMDLVILYRDHVTFYHDKGKTKKTQQLSSGYGTNPWTIGILIDLDGINGAEMLCVRSNLNQYLEFEIAHDRNVANSYHNTYMFQTNNIIINWNYDTDGVAGCDIACIQASYPYTPINIYHDKTRTFDYMQFVYSGWNDVAFADYAGLGRTQIGFFYPGGIPGYYAGYHTLAFDNKTMGFRYY